MKGAVFGRRAGKAAAEEALGKASDISLDTAEAHGIQSTNQFTEAIKQVNGDYTKPNKLDHFKPGKLDVDMTIQGVQPA